MKMYGLKLSTIFVVFFLLFTLNSVAARPYRIKRGSDQRLAELETLITLHKLKGKLITVPVGWGQIDPAIVGRRRRRTPQFLEKLFSPKSESKTSDLISSEDYFN